MLEGSPVILLTGDQGVVESFCGQPPGWARGDHNIQGIAPIDFLQTKLSDFQISEFLISIG